MKWVHLLPAHSIGRNLKSPLAQSHGFSQAEPIQSFEYGVYLIDSGVGLSSGDEYQLEFDLAQTTWHRLASRSKFENYSQNKP
ncbi:MAG TPA: hypothetical protein EYG38_02000 [Verrucomicrobia bacterium]|nr:hypothetical protein [Verrucomicrobiota bacterium]